MNKINLKENIIYILIIVVISFTTSLSVYAATTYTYNSADVWYDKSTSQLTSSNVKGALDELHTTATNYTSITTRTTTLENYFPSFTYNGSTSNVYSEDGMNLGKIAATTQKSFVNFNSTGQIYADTAGTFNIQANTSGTAGQGTLNLNGNPVQFNGSDVSFLGNIGNSDSSSEFTISNPSGTTKRTSWTLSTPGVYIIQVGGYFPTSATGSRIMQLHQGGSLISRSSFSTATGVSDMITQMNLVAIATVTSTSSTQNFEIVTEQQSGSTQSIKARIWYVRIK